MRGVGGQLALDGEGGLQDVGRPHSRTDLLDHLGGLETLQSGGRRHVGEEVGIRHHELLLHEAVEALRGQRIAEPETVVEDAEARAQHGLRALLAAAAGRPGKRETGRKIAPVVDIGLRLVAQAQVEREIRPHAPLVAREDSHIHLVHRKFGRAGIDGELRGAAAERADHRRRIAQLLEEQRPPVAFDRSDGRQLRLAVGARHGPVLRIQHGRQRAAAKRETSR